MKKIIRLSATSALSIWSYCKAIAIACYRNPPSCALPKQSPPYAIFLPGNPSQMFGPFDNPEEAEQWGLKNLPTEDGLPTGEAGAWHIDYLRLGPNR